MIRCCAVCVALTSTVTVELKSTWTLPTKLFQCSLLSQLLIGKYLLTRSWFQSSVTEDCIRLSQDTDE